MKATINLRAVNGYIEPRHFVRAVNDNITFTLDTALDCVFFLEWNGQVFSVADKQVTIPYNFIGDENTVVVRADTKRFNCGKLFTKPIDAEMVEMLDIESKYRQDIEKLLTINAGLQSALSVLNRVEEKLIIIEKKYDTIINGVNIFSKE